MQHEQPPMQISTVPTQDKIMAHEREHEMSSKEISKLTALEIIKAINEIPLFQKEEVTKSYQGIRVKWRVTVSHFFSRNGSVVNLMTRYEGKYPRVLFKVDVNKYPELKVTKEGKAFLVTGLITKYEHGDFELELEAIKEERREHSRS